MSPVKLNTTTCSHSVHITPNVSNITVSDIKSPWHPWHKLHVTMCEIFIICLVALHVLQFLVIYASLSFTT